MPEMLFSRLALTSAIFTLVSLKARAIFLELSETLMESSERDPEDEDEEDASALADQFENTTVTIEEIIASFEDLRDN